MEADDTHRLLLLFMRANVSRTGALQPDELAEISWMPLLGGVATELQQRTAEDAATTLGPKDWLQLCVPRPPLAHRPASPRSACRQVREAPRQRRRAALLRRAVRGDVRHLPRAGAGAAGGAARGARGAGGVRGRGEAGQHAVPGSRLRQRAPRSLRAGRVRAPPRPLPQPASC